ncbi:PspC domain-containing protein [Terrabacter lapilli]|uniref:ATP-binding protein n=1 Tax=Terrabacter lapilli TaxID=436231 RepID=UPI0031DCEE08
MRVDPERTLTRPPKVPAEVAPTRRVGEDGTVQTAYENGAGPARPTWRTTPRPPLVRHRQGKVIAGVAAGLADHLGLPVVAVRVALVLTSIPFGAGLVVYVFLWATMREVGDVDPAVAATPGATSPATQVPGTAGASRPHVDLTSLRSWLRSGNQAVVITLLGVAALAVAGALWLGSAGLGVHVEVVLPLVAIVIGAIFFWSQLDDTDHLGTRRPVRWIWLVVGLGLTILGLVGLLVRGTNLAELWQVAGAVLAALVGVAVLCAPWILRLWSNLRLEQAARIRATERADIAAHLHDSVLQTLALIQRQSGDAAAVARLARAQERQLRSYLYDEDARAGTLGAALTAAMGEVEDLHGVPVQLVVTGDRPMDEHLDALVKAVREAAWNAVRHASPPVSTYVEVGPDAVEAFVRDHGAGFDIDAVPDDRAGVRQSIIGRMERHGGTARIRRRPDGTEVELRLPVGQAPDPEQPSPTSPAGSSAAATASPTTSATPSATPGATPGATPSVTETQEQPS